MCETRIHQLGMLKHRVESDACIQQRPTIQTYLNKGCRLMLVRHPVIQSTEMETEGMSACEQMDAWFEKYNTTFHATRAFVRSLRALQ